MEVVRGACRFLTDGGVYSGDPGNLPLPRQSVGDSDSEIYNRIAVRDFNVIDLYVSSIKDKLFIYLAVPIIIAVFLGLNLFLEAHADIQYVLVYFVYYLI